VFLIYGSKITAASRGFPATARLSCNYSYSFVGMTRINLILLTKF